MPNGYALQLQSTNRGDFNRHDTADRLRKSGQYAKVFRVLSVENTDTLRWTGKAFTGRHKNKGNTWLIKAVMKGMNPNWQRHALWVTVRMCGCLETA